MRNSALKGMLDAASPIKQRDNGYTPPVPKPPKAKKKSPPPKPPKTYGFGITEPA